MRVCLAIAAVLVVGACPRTSCIAVEPARIQKSIARVERMPNMPSPYGMRDWKQVAKDYDALVFDFLRTGKNLPLVWWDPRRLDLPVKTFALPSFVGHYVKADNHYDTITCLGAVYGATLVGIDKSAPQGRDWVAMCTNYFNPVEHERLYLNNIGASTGGSFWYELFPSILFYRVFEAYRDTAGMAEHFTTTADRWVEACEGMGGKTDPWTVPDFNHTAYNFASGEPFDNDLWKEAGSAAAIAWIEYLAYTQTKEKKYLTAARWGMESLGAASRNPFYEVLFPHGVYTAARMNAELGTEYDVEKLINWCFDGDNSRGWGVSAARWGDYDCSGLSSSIHAGDDQHDYAFAMNTFNLADSLVPISRYDDRYAREIGKWMLNAASSMRLFYANGLPADQQTDYDWAKKHDPTSCLAYEGLRSSNISLSRISADYKTVAGTIKSGSFQDTLFTNRVYQQLEESAASGPGTRGGDALEHLWKAEIGTAIECEIHVVAKSSGDEAFRLSYATDPAGPFEELAVVDSQDNAGFAKSISPKGPTLYLKAEDAGTATTSDRPGVSSPGTLFIDDVWIVLKRGAGPVATGDAKDNAWADTNFGLYGSSFVGIYGAIIETTNVEGILQLDCLATDHYHALAYPTYLYYNPHAKLMQVEIDLGLEKEPHDLYDAVADEFLVRNVSGKTSFPVGPDSARLLVIVPAGGVAERRDHRLIVDDVVVDYNYYPRHYYPRQAPVETSNEPGN